MTKISQDASNATRVPLDIAVKALSRGVVPTCKAHSLASRESGCEMKEVSSQMTLWTSSGHTVRST